MNEQKSNQPSKCRRYLFYGFIVAAASFLIITLDYGARLNFGVFFKPMANEFGWTRGLTSGSVTLSMVFQGVGAIVMGKLNDKLGPRFVMTLCGILLGIGYLLMSTIYSAWQLYLFYGVIFGLGMGGAFVALQSTIARWFIKMRGLMTGIAIAGTGIGQLVISPVSNWLISIYHWRASYLILGGIVLVMGILLAQLLKRDPARMGLVPYGQKKEEKQKLISNDQGLSLGEAIRTRQYWMIVLIFFSIGYIVMGMNTHLVPHITDLGISSTIAANVFAVAGGVSAIGCIVLGSSIDKLGSRRVVMICLFIIIATLLWLTRITAVWIFFLFAIIYGLGFGGTTPTESTMVADLFGIKYHGVILGSVSLGFSFGGALGPFVTGDLFDINGNYQIAFLIFAGIAAVALIAVALLRPVKRPKVSAGTQNIG